MNIIPGNTKLVELNIIEKKFGLKCRIFAKVENTNPSGSIKDRAVYQMLLDYKEKGILKESGSTIIEATSGNTGISLAYYSKIFNYRLVICMPKSMSKERREMISSYGGELVLTDGGMLESEKKAQELVKTIPSSFIFNQFNNKSNAKAHYLTTGPEILADLPSVSYVFAGIGTGGTISGIAEYLTNVKVVGVEPLESPLLTKGIAGPHLIQGIGANFVPSILRRDLLSDVIAVSGEKSIEMAKIIREEEKLDVGISSGASLLGAIEYINDFNISDKDIVVIFPDKGDRYLWKNA